MRSGLSPPPMRILFWNQAYLPRRGGVESFTARLAGGLVEAGHHPVVVTQRQAAAEPDEETVEGVSVHRFDFAKALDIRADPAGAIRHLGRLTGEIAALKQRIRPDMVHVNLTDGSPIFHLRSADAWPCPTIVTLHANLAGEASAGSVARALVESAARVTAVCRFAAEDLAAKTGLPMDRIEVIAPGVVPFRFSRCAPETAGRSNLLFVGRLVPGKGVEFAIRAMAELPENVTLTIAGDGPERAALEQLASELALGGRVAFLGEVDTQRQLPVDAVAMLVPSEHELFGTVAAEASLAGLPVIASSVGGLPEVVDDGVTGYLVPPRDPGAIAQAAQALIGDPARARAMGAAARDKALRLYGVDRMLASYLRVYRSCLAG